MAEGSLQKRYLVVVRVGDNSLHQEWIRSAEYRNFDLCLSYYGDTPGRYKEDCEIYTEAKGPKWPKIYDLIETMGDRIFQYDAVWFPDDDIQTTPDNISRMFELFMEHKLLLAQPALTANSYFQVTAQHIDYKLRYTHFVEIMVPVFSRDALRICCPTFNKSVTGWGMEFVWAKLLGYPDKGMAILDETPVKHTRPPGKGDLYENIKKQLKINIWDPKYKDVWNEYGVKMLKPSKISYHGGIKKWDPNSALADKGNGTIRQTQAVKKARKTIKKRAKRLAGGKRVRLVNKLKRPASPRPAAGTVRKRIRRKKAAPPLTFIKARIKKLRKKRISLTRSRLKKRSSR